MSDFARSNEQAILDVLSGQIVALGLTVRCELGEAEDARRGAPPRIVWVPRRGGRRYTHPAQQRDGMKVGHEKNVQYDVHVWGSSVADASRIEELLIAALFNAFSPNAYDLGEGGPALPPETPGDGKGYELVIPIRLLRIPVPAERRGSTGIDSAEATGSVNGAIGEDPTSSAPTVSITYS